MRIRRSYAISLGMLYCGDRSRAFRRSLLTILFWMYSCLGRRTDVLTKPRTRILIHKVFNYTYMEMFYAHSGVHRLHCRILTEKPQSSGVMFHLAAVWIETFRVCDRLVYNFKSAGCTYTLHNSIHSVQSVGYYSVMWIVMCNCFCFVYLKIVSL